jgi:opacity protein-like surface antigen
MRGLILILAAVAVTPSMAAEFEPGVYLAADTARASTSSKYAADDDNDLSFGGKIGYQYTRNFGFDVYTRTLSMNPLRGLASEAGYYPDRNYGIAVQGTAPLNERFSVFGRAGIGRTKLQPNRTSLKDKEETDGMVGVGLSFNFSRQWSINLEGSYLTKTEVKLISFGGRFQF